MNDNPLFLVVSRKRGIKLRLNPFYGGVTKGKFEEAGLRLGDFLETCSMIVKESAGVCAMVFAVIFMFAIITPICAAYMFLNNVKILYRFFRRKVSR